MSQNNNSPEGWGDWNVNGDQGNQHADGDFAWGQVDAPRTNVDAPRTSVSGDQSGMNSFAGFGSNNPHASSGSFPPAGGMPQGGPMGPNGQMPPTGYMPAQPYPQAPMQPVQQKSSSALPAVMVGLAVILLLVVAGGAAYFFLGQSPEEDIAAELNPRPEAVIVPEVEEETTEVTVTTTTTKERAEDFSVPSSWDRCGGSGAPGNLNLYYAGTDVTSCPFAEAVRDEFVDYYMETDRLSGVIEAYSPVTGKTYSMRCVDNGDYVTCKGGNNAVVHIL